MSFDRIAIEYKDFSIRLNMRVWYDYDPGEIHIIHKNIRIMLFQEYIYRGNRGTVKLNPTQVLHFSGNNGIVIETNELYATFKCDEKTLAELEGMLFRR